MTLSKIHQRRLAAGDFSSDFRSSLTPAFGTAEKTRMGHDDKRATAATLMLLLGKEAAANVMQHLTDDEVRQISSQFSVAHGQAEEQAEEIGRLLDASNFPA